MTDLATLVSCLRAQGANLYFNNGKLIVEAPAGIITPEQVAILRARKSEIVELLAESSLVSKRPGASFCNGCCEIASGSQLHPPKETRNWQAWLRKWQPNKAVVQ